MKQQFYTVYDIQAEEYGSPFTSKNDLTGARAFRNLLINNPNKKDFELYKIGEFDTDTGKISTYNKDKIEVLFSPKEMEE